jgi:hypothetical protein
MIGREAGNATLADTMARASIARQPFPDIGPRNNGDMSNGRILVQNAPGNLGRILVQNAPGNLAFIE